jgi:hypothetical protein
MNGWLSLDGAWVELMKGVPLLGDAQLRSRGLTGNGQRAAFSSTPFPMSADLGPNRRLKPASRDED